MADKAESAAKLKTFILQHVVPLQTKTTQDIISNINIQHPIKVIHVRKMITDGGTEYLGAFKGMCTSYGIAHSTTTPYTPELNSKAERYWRTVCPPGSYTRL